MRSETRYNIRLDDLRVRSEGHMGNVLNSAPHVITRMLPALSHLDGNRIHFEINSTGLVARYDFDLREHMGISCNRVRLHITFRNQERIRIVLPPHGPSPFDGPSLSELEATRHVLVHREGIVDAEFKKRIPSRRTLANALF